MLPPLSIFEALLDENTEISTECLQLESIVRISYHEKVDVM